MSKTIKVGGQVLEFRPATEKDKAYIVGTWYKSYLGRLEGLVPHRPSPRPAAVSLSHATGRLWKHSWVLCSGDTIHGWVCFERRQHNLPVLHYAYVGMELRRNGLCRAMVAEVFGQPGPNKHDLHVIHSHEWPFSKKPAGWQRDPYLMSGVNHGS